MRTKYLGRKRGKSGSEKLLPEPVDVEEFIERCCGFMFKLSASQFRLFSARIRSATGNIYYVWHHPKEQHQLSGHILVRSNG